MTTEAKFKYALKEMMLSQPLNEINVTVLCDKCGCHRQTFYYHYQDIYDLLAAIFLNEKIPGLSSADDVKQTLIALINYAKDNFEFLKSSYNSAAHDLVENFFLSKVMSKVFLILVNNNNYGLTKDSYRNAARRFARFIGEEFSYSFKDARITPGKFEKNMKKFVNCALLTILPSLIELSKEEKKKQ
ncbi:MAG: hypothetical protein MJ238_02530 [Bacilli bacterium]|nr:hypothetical protein [Bacilli bacterium]